MKQYPKEQLTDVISITTVHSDTIACLVDNKRDPQDPEVRIYLIVSRNEDECGVRYFSDGEDCDVLLERDDCRELKAIAVKADASHKAMTGKSSPCITDRDWGWCFGLFEDEARTWAKRVGELYVERVREMAD